MPSRKAPLWTTGRKWLGNLLPLVISLPILGFAVLSLQQTGTSPTTLAWFAAFPLVGWWAVNLLALVGNGNLKKAVENRFLVEKPELKGDRFFVGFARPSYRDALDPHEDVGFLILGENELEFYGGHLNFAFHRGSIKKVRFQLNPHSYLLLGRFVRIEAEEEGQGVVMLVEPREKRTLWGNRILSQKLRKQIEDYAKSAQSE